MSALEEELGVRYRGLLWNAAPDAMLVVDQTGNIVLLNVQTERQFGYRHDELLQRPITDIIPSGFSPPQFGTKLELMLKSFVPTKSPRI